jgi:cell division protein FtsL
LGKEKKGGKGSFRATLALIISVVALILAIVAVTRTDTQSQLNAEVKNLQKKIKEMKQETTVRLDKVRQETGVALEKIGKVIKKEQTKR